MSSPDLKLVNPQGRRGSSFLQNGHIRVTAYGIYFGDNVYEAIGSPKNINVLVDTVAKIIQLKKSNNASGWKPTILTKSDGSRYYRLRASRSPIFEKMPLGIYYAIGGGMYALNEQTNSTINQ